MIEILITNYGLLIYPDLPAQVVSKCTTYTDSDTTCLQFATIALLRAYAAANNITLPAEI